MLFLNEDLPMRGDIAPRFVVGDGDEWKVRAERFEEHLSTFATPDFDDVLMHVLVFILSRADGNRLPRDLDAVPVSFGIRPTRTGIVWRYRKFRGAGVYDGKHLPIASHFQELGVDPAFILAIHPDPVVGIRAADKFDVGAFHQGIEI